MNKCLLLFFLLEFNCYYMNVELFGGIGVEVLFGKFILCFLGDGMYFYVL